MASNQQNNQYPNDSSNEQNGFGQDIVPVNYNEVAQTGNMNGPNLGTYVIKCKCGIPRTPFQQNKQGYWKFFRRI